MQQLSTERANRNRDQLNLQETISNLEQSLQSEQQAAEGAVSAFVVKIFTCLTFAAVCELGTSVSRCLLSFQF